MEILRQLHSSVSQTFDQSFDDAYRQLNVERTAQDERIKRAEEMTKVANAAQLETATRVNELEHENEALREELHACEIHPKTIESYALKSLEVEQNYAPENIPELCESDNADRPGSDTKEHDRVLSTKYRELYKETQTLLDVSRKLRAHVTQHKRKLEIWHNKLNGENFTIPFDGASVTFQRVRGLSRKDRTHLSSISHIQHLAQPAVAESHLTRTNSSRNQPDLGDEIEGNAINVAQPLCTTESESIFAQPAPTPASKETTPSGKVSNELIAPMDGSLKRKRATLAEGPVVIKNESPSSSPFQNLSHFCGAASTQDLDEIGSTVETPRKKKGFESGHHNTDARATSSKSWQTRGLEVHHRNSREWASDQRPLKHDTVLQPVEINSQAVDPPARRPDIKSMKSFERITRHAIPSVAEDGDEIYPSDGTMRQLEKSASESTEQSGLGANNELAQQRLQDLLDGPLPSKAPLQKQKCLERPLGSRRHSSCGSVDPINQHSTLRCSVDANNGYTPNTKPPQAIWRHTPQRCMSSAHTSGSHDSYDRSETCSERRPYRALPLHQLKLSHFKINPEYNHGLDFAYDSVIRKKDERKCVAGCTRPDCCGDKFRAMVRIGGVSTGSSQREKDREVLEEYLGNEKHLLDKLDERELDELLQEAQARKFANDFGKHRHNHQRPRTPPGFWRTDMPSTQELEDDREKANHLESEKISERYREAMRPGGLWTFADE